ncbi:MAG: serine/threonine protein kinase [Fuerstiella sp.]|nr:serine/threonine protein kinase [Fuerstiella sp.]MCP4855240.1 serine/threonine protein kinase [Fuerstiella sp.]
MNPFNVFRRTNAETQPQPHATWASRSFSQGMTRTRLFLKKQLWAWPIIAVIVLSVLGFMLRSSIESTIKTNLSSGLQTVLTLETEMLQNWFATQQHNAESIANNKSVRQLFETVAAGADDAAQQAKEELRQQLSPRLTANDYVGFFAADDSGQIVASSYASLVGQQQIQQFNRFLSRALDGETIVSPPFGSVVLMRSESEPSMIGLPVMYVCAPIRDDSFRVIGALAMQIRPEEEFTRILQYGRVGESGETYAFDRDGVLVSNSRFDHDLILLGLLPDQEDSRSILNVLVRDPGGDVTAGFRPAVRRAKLPLTKMAASAIAGETAVDVEGYRDYRGVPVVGAWTWLPEYEIGVTTEVDVAQAFRPIIILQRAFWILYSLLIVSSIAIFVFTLVVARARRDAQKAAVEAQQLGQYTLDGKLGAGAMGVVYRGHHSMLRRQTAIKMLDVDKVNDESIARFEREVQITCQLNHPNTIAIYDYGRTPEGVFYYAMEYLDGLELQDLVQNYGPQPEHRVIHILLQMCGSLHEAHTLGLVHRDIKPANVMLNRRGGEADVVKVLDFGLVRAMDQDKQSGMTAAGALTGTPLYMSPEAIESPASVDARSDLYAVGAVGYFLLTGEPVFSAESIVELCQQHVDESPTPPSERFGRPFSDQLEHAVLSCLEKSRTKRPQTARELAQLLLLSPMAHQWSNEDADSWWSRHERGLPPETSSDASRPDRTVALDQTFISSTATDSDRDEGPPTRPK